CGGHFSPALFPIVPSQYTSRRARCYSVRERRGAQNPAGLLDGLFARAHLGYARLAGCGKSLLALEPLRPPAVFPLIVPQITEVRLHLTGEEIDILERQLVRHRSDMQQHHQVTDAETLDGLR